MSVKLEEGERERERWTLAIKEWKTRGSIIETIEKQEEGEKPINEQEMGRADNYRAHCELNSCVRGKKTLAGENERFFLHLTKPWILLCNHRNGQTCDL